MKCKAILAICLSGLLLLSGCGPRDQNTEHTPEHFQTEYQESDPTDPSAETEISDPAELKNPEEQGMVRSILTNEWVTQEVASIRPIAVIIPNEARAIPHFNLSEASVLYETKVEGSMSRMMGIFEDWEKLERLGNVRSLRSYFAYWAFEWDAIIVHYGGPYFIYDLLEQDGTENIDGMKEEDGNAFFRTLDRDAPHNAYTSGARLLSSIQKDGYSLSYRSVTEKKHFQFNQDGTSNDLSQYGDSAQVATFIDMTAAFPLTRCYFDYNEEDELYYRYQYLSGGVDGPHMDGATGEQLCFSNILVQRIRQEDIGKGYLAMQCHDTTKDGWFFTRGKGIHVTWKKISDYGATKFYDDNGKEITLNDGKTMILVIRDSDNFTYR